MIVIYQNSKKRKPMITLIKNTDNSKQQLFPFQVDKSNNADEASFFNNMLGMVKETLDNKSSQSKENQQAMEKGNLFRSIETKDGDQKSKKVDDTPNNNQINSNQNDNAPIVGDQVELQLIVAANKTVQQGTEKPAIDSEMIAGIVFKDGKIIKNSAFTSPTEPTNVTNLYTDNPKTSQTTFTVGNKNIAAELNSDKIILGDGQGISATELEKLGFQRLVDQSSLVDTELKKIDVKIQALIDKSFQGPEKIDKNGQLIFNIESNNQRLTNDGNQGLTSNIQLGEKSNLAQQPTSDTNTAQFSERVFQNTSPEAMINSKNPKANGNNIINDNQSAVKQPNGTDQPNSQQFKIDTNSDSANPFQNQQNSRSSDQGSVVENIPTSPVNKFSQSNGSENFAANTKETTVSEKVNIAKDSFPPSQEQNSKISDKVLHSTGIKGKSDAQAKQTNENIPSPFIGKSENISSSKPTNDNQNNTNVFTNEASAKTTNHSNINAQSDRTRSASSTIVGKVTNIKEAAVSEKLNIAKDSLPSSQEQNNKISNNGLHSTGIKGKSNAQATQTNEYIPSSNKKSEINSSVQATKENQYNKDILTNEASAKTTNHSDINAHSDRARNASSTIADKAAITANGSDKSNLVADKQYGNIQSEQKLSNIAKSETLTAKNENTSSNSHLNSSKQEPVKADLQVSQQNDMPKRVEKESQDINNKPIFDSKKINSNQSEKLSNQKPASSSMVSNEADININRNQRSEAIDGGQLKTTSTSQTNSAEKEVIISTNATDKKSSVDLNEVVSNKINQNKPAINQEVAASRNSEQEGKKLNANLYNAESRAVNPNQSSPKNDVKNSSEQIVTKESDTNQDNNRDFSQSSHNSYENDDSKETVFNKFTPEKKSVQNRSFADQLNQEDAEKQSKINPLAEPNPAQKMDVTPPEIRPVNYTDMREAIQKIERMVIEASQNKLNNTSFSLDSKEFGKMEIHIRQNSKEDQGVILVENHTIKEQIQKFIPDIQENLNQKGVMISAVNVEVNSQNESTDPQSRFSRKRNNRKVDSTNNNYGSASEIDTKTTKTRSYGYNTMEVLA